MIREIFVGLLVGSLSAAVVLSDINGMPEAEALAAIEAAGHTVGTVDYRYDDNMPAGKVISHEVVLAQINKAVRAEVNISLQSGFFIVSIDDGSGMKKVGTVYPHSVLPIDIKIGGHLIATIEAQDASASS